RAFYGGAADDGEGGRRLVVERGVGERWGRQRGFDPYGGVAQLFGGGDGLLLAAGDHAQEAAVADDGEHAGHLLDGRGIDGPQARSGLGRAHDPAVDHAGQGDVVDEDWLSGDFGRKVEAFGRGADDGMGGGRLRVDGVGDLDAEA